MFLDFYACANESKVYYYVHNKSSHLLCMVRRILKNFAGWNFHRVNLNWRENSLSVNEEQFKITFVFGDVTYGRASLGKKWAQSN
jgi:hypothetical protein